METPEGSNHMNSSKPGRREILAIHVQGTNHVSYSVLPMLPRSHVWTDRQRSGKSGQATSTSRDKFEPIDSPYMAPALQSWQNALSAVNCSPEELFSSTKLAENDGRYAFPEPGLFCSGNNDRRRN